MRISHRKRALAGAVFLRPSITEAGLEQSNYIFKALSAKASKLMPKEFADLGDLVAIDGSLIDAVLSMTWADYRKGSNKAKVHLGFNINQKIPSKVFLTNGNEAERPFVLDLILPGQTGVCDRGYQCHLLFDMIHFEENIMSFALKKRQQSHVSKKIRSTLIVLYFMILKFS